MADEHPLPIETCNGRSGRPGARRRQPLPPGIASGQQFDGSVRLVVANPAGGPLDIVARSIADFLAAKWKQTVLVENGPGGNGIIAANYVAKAKPDGQTLLMTATYSESILPYAAEKLPYNAEKDFIPVTEIARVGFVLVGPGRQFNSYLSGLC